MGHLSWYSIGICLVVSWGGYAYGFGFASFITSQGQPTFYTYFSLDPASAYTAKILGACNALFNFGLAMGALFQGWLCDALGRKRAFLVAGLCSLLGGALITGAHVIEMLIPVRVLHGFGLNMLICLVPLYLTEVAPAEKRGLLAGLMTLSFSMGYVVCGYIAVGTFYGTTYNVQVRLPLAMAMVGPAALLLGLPFIPESPRYLVLNNQGAEALDVLRRIHGDPSNPDDTFAQAEYTQIVAQTEKDQETTASYLEMFRKPSWRKRSVLALFIQSVIPGASSTIAMRSSVCTDRRCPSDLQLNPLGYARVLGYLTSSFADGGNQILGIANYLILIFSSLGVSPVMSLVLYAVYATVGIFTVLLTIFTVDRIGRRTLFLYGFPLVAIILVIEGVLQSKYLGTDHQAGLAACVLVIFVYIVVFQAIDAPAFIWIAEIFPTNIRGRGIGLGFFAYFVGAITYSTPSALAFRNLMYFIYAGLSVLSTIIVYFYIPETKQIPVEEIGALFGDEVVVHLTEAGQSIVEEKNTLPRASTTEVVTAYLMNNASGLSAATHKDDGTTSHDAAFENWIVLLSACMIAMSLMVLDFRFYSHARRLLLVTVWLCRREAFGCLRGLYDMLSWPYNLMAVAYATFAFLRTARLGGITAGAGDEPPPRPFLPPLIFPCHTTHSRFFPARHSFTYSYLQVGIPIGWRHSSGFLTCDTSEDLFGRKTSGWFSVHDEDYLARGTHQDGLRGKLDDFLKVHGITAAELPYAYLVTAPRFLGWSFNPVSFWYLYDSMQKLKAMILEVNNTFDERRMYLLKPEKSSENGRFSETWAKDFHVSPFNDRTGSYSVVAMDPFERFNWTRDKRPDAVNIDNNITLTSLPPNAKPKLVARLYSTSKALDPAQMTLFEYVVFMCQWCWTGFLTNPRILWEARILWAKKQLQVFFRPEVNIGSIGRQEQKEEIVIEICFQQWLDELAHREKCLIEYTCAAGANRGKTLTLGDSSGPVDVSVSTETAKLEVLTPEWYSELARTDDMRELFQTRCFESVDGEMMLSVNSAGRRLLEAALYKMSRSSEDSEKDYVKVPLASDRRSDTSPQDAVVQNLIAACTGKAVKYRGLQACFRQLLDPLLTPTLLRGYDRAAWSIMLADRLAFGSTGLLKCYINIASWGATFVAGHYLAPLVKSVLLEMTA
ncbi:Low-affinity glucose transporter HXT3 [Cyphellophora attinorum]|uniref:Low-affinity glucose transporter HXT3 n=1 Tax=Cyphellophora attinorum TaxID=1664694 RepID=A0A0N1HQK2_9EURO|nr:Low-affinity glucose transporter HXT3 [Phialophora attinorum]KPI40243.1 Low-affinity glucose transporter HXT3 [Phialophora attinorum]